MVLPVWRCNGKLVYNEQLSASSPLSSFFGHGNNFPMYWRFPTNSLPVEIPEQVECREGEPMSNTTTLKEIERRAYLSYHQEGIVDLCVGSALLSLSLMMWFLPEFWFFIVGGLIALTSVYALAKKTITIPRMGYVEFSTSRRQKTQYIFLTFVVVTVFGNILGIIAMLFPPLGILIFESIYTILIIGVIGGVLLFMVGFISSIRRFYMYALVFVGSTIFTFLIPIFVLLPLFALGFVMIIYGAVLLFRFLQQYPKVELGEVESG